MKRDEEGIIGTRPIDRRCIAANLFLKGLHPVSAELLAPLLDEVRVASGSTLPSGDFANGLIYFPTSLVTCVKLRSYRTGIALVGREGVIGWQAIFDTNIDEYEAQVLLEGGATLTISVENMRRVCLQSPDLMTHMLRFIRSYTFQLSCSVSSSSRATLKQRLAAWLLMIHDRIDGDFLQITHGSLAAQLGVRRASVTDCLHVLEGDDSLRCARGLIVLRDRALLEAFAGNAYSESFPLPQSGVAKRPAKSRHRPPHRTSRAELAPFVTA